MTMTMAIIILLLIIIIIIIIIIIVMTINNNQGLRSVGDKNGRSKRFQSKHCALRKLKLSVVIVTASC